MDLEELEPRKPPRFELGADLSALSVEELKELVVKLNEEVARINDAIKAKESSRAAADSVFKS